MTVKQKMKKNKTGLAFIFICCLLVLVGCSEKQGDLNVQLGGKVEETDDQIIIEGKSNLLPGSRVNGVVFVNGDEPFSESTELVGEDGTFRMELDHHRYGDAEVAVTFDFLDSVQDEEIIEHYGEGGGKLEGPYVYVVEDWDNSDPKANKKAEVRLPLAFDDEATTHTFEEPEWEERPDDYGDPRVWIEVDEITDDKEYFYVKGHTNLLEGSEMKGYYESSFRDDKTRVNPDGTFELQIEYYYAENEPFVITFNPSGQWSTIKEAYGDSGEKLVGSLVDTSGSSQKIVLELEYTHE